jgi:polyphosphate kinase
MNRNLDRRVEVLFPLLDERLKERVRREVLDPAMNDNVKMRWLQPDGTYLRPRGGRRACGLQASLLAPALQRDE